MLNAEGIRGTGGACCVIRREDEGDGDAWVDCEEGLSAGKERWRLRCWLFRDEDTRGTLSSLVFSSMGELTLTHLSTYTLDRLGVPKPSGGCPYGFNWGASGVGSTIWTLL